MVIIELPIYGRTLNRVLITEAEQLATDEIRRQFSQDLDRSMLEVVILGVRNGEVVPVITTAVSRDQWSQNPQVRIWSRYNGLSYVLLHRDSEDVEPAPSFSTPTPSSFSESVAFNDPVSQVEEAFQEGRLNRDEYEQLVDELD